MDIVKPDVKINYLCYKDINNYLIYLAKRYISFVKVINVAKTFEGGCVKGIHIDHYFGKGEKHEVKRNMIFIEAGTHAREWITTSVALYCISQLTEKHFRNMDLLSQASFFIIPLANPDGYEFSRTKVLFEQSNLNIKFFCSF